MWHLLPTKKSRLTCPFRAIANIQQERRPILLPGLNYTEWQQIWLAKTILWCGSTKFSEESQRYQISKLLFDGDHHSTGAFRILGPFSNSAQFSKDWSCPKDSPMNPAEKCTLYGDDLWFTHTDLDIHKCRYFCIYKPLNKAFCIFNNDICVLAQTYSAE